MEATNTKYDFTKSLDRIDEILKADNKSFEELDSIPSRERLTYTNGFYVDCTAVFVDICDSSSMTDEHKRPVLAKIYRSFISEMVALFNGCDHCREISINGDCVWAVFDTPYRPDLDEAFSAACAAHSLIEILNYKLEKKGYNTYDANIGIDDGRALMIQAGYKGSKINDVIWMGDVVNSACHLCSEDRGFFGKTIFLSEAIYNNLNEHHQSLCSLYDSTRKIYQSSAINTKMNNWLENQKKQ